MEQQEETLGDEREQLVLRKLREVRLNALTGGDIEQPVTAGTGSDGLVKHDPTPGEKAAIQATYQAWVQRGPAPRRAHSAEADVVGHVVGEDELRNQAGRPVPANVRPVPPSPATE